MNRNIYLKAGEKVGHGFQVGDYVRHTQYYGSRGIIKQAEQEEFLGEEMTKMATVDWGGDEVPCYCMVENLKKVKRKPIK